MRTLKYLIFACALSTTYSCSEDLANPELNENLIDNPSTYQFERNGRSTVSFSGQTTRIKMATELVHAMTDFSISEQRLLEMYANQTSTGGDANPFRDSNLNDETKSIKSKIAASVDFFSANTAQSSIIKSDIEAWIKAQVSEVYTSKNELAAPGQAGQIADGTIVRYVNAKGLEYNQAVSKSLIGALMIDQISNHYLSPMILDEGDNIANNDAGKIEDGKTYTTMEHKWDEAYGYLFGATNNTSDPISSLGDDGFLNKYLSRVNDDIDFTGIANDIFQAFKLGRAAIVAGNYEIRDQQAELIKEKLAIVVAARAVYYMQQGKIAIPEAGNLYGAAFHNLSEGFGFVYSLQFIRTPNSDRPYFSSSEVENFINLLIDGNGLWDVSATTLDQISEDIASRFNFTVAQAAE